MTSLQEKIIKPKLGFLALARQLVNQTGFTGDD